MSVCDKSISCSIRFNTVNHTIPYTGVGCLQSLQNSGNGDVSIYIPLTIITNVKIVFEEINKTSISEK